MDIGWYKRIIQYYFLDKQIKKIQTAGKKGNGLHLIGKQFEERLKRILGLFVCGCNCILCDFGYLSWLFCSTLAGLSDLFIK